MVSVTKIFWEKPLSEEKLNSKIDSEKSPGNCGSLKQNVATLKSGLGDQTCCQDCKKQKVQKLLTVSASHKVQASSELKKQLVPSKQSIVDSIDVKVPLTLLKNTLSLSGKLNQSINQLRRSFIKPSLLVLYAKLDIADNSSQHLFRDSITHSLESLKKENQMKVLLRKELNLLGKRKHFFPQQSSNFKASSKTLMRTQDQGHYVRRSNQSQNYNNSYNNYNNYNQHNSTKKDTYQKNIDFKKKETKTKETLISFQNALQVKKIDLILKYLRQSLSHSRIEPSSFTKKNWRNLGLIQRS